MARGVTARPRRMVAERRGSEPGGGAGPKALARPGHSATPLNPKSSKKHYCLLSNTSAGDRGNGNKVHLRPELTENVRV